MAVGDRLHEDTRLITRSRSKEGGAKGGDTRPSAIFARIVWRKRRPWAVLVPA